MAEEHACQHERDFGQIKQICLNDIPRMEETINKIFNRLEGNGKTGLMTRMAVMENGFQTIPTLRKVMILASVWGGISGAVIIGGFFGIRFITGGS